MPWDSLGASRRLDVPHLALSPGSSFRGFLFIAPAASSRRTLPSRPRASPRSRESPNMVMLSFSAFRIFLPRGFSLERDGGARVLLSTPARKYLQPRECFEKRGVFRTPLPRSLSAAGFVSHFPPPALGERRHRSIACRLIAVDRPAIFVVAVGQRPEPRHPHGRGGGLQDARATTAVRASYSGVNRSSTCKLHQTK